MQIPVSQLKSGEKLADNVLTKFNHVLMQKGRHISDKDIVVLKAFQIASVFVEVEGDELLDDRLNNEAVIGEKKKFNDHYQVMLKLMERTFVSAAAGSYHLSIPDIRNELEQLLPYIDQYQVLTFVPEHFKPSDYLYHKSIMVGLTSYLLAQWIHLPSKDWVPVAMAGLLHDIGNAKVDPNILFKPDRLEQDEMREMKEHSLLGYKLLKNIPIINEGVKLASLQHHEREDGTGYPQRVKGDKIHVYAKIIAIADVYHAITTDRLHKKASSPYLALEKLKDESFGKLEPTYVQTFIQKTTNFHNGKRVKLSDGRVGEIVFSDQHNPTRPWVSVNGHIVNLVSERNIYIHSVLES